MLVNFLKTFGWVCAAIPIILTLCAFYAYRVNEEREPGDPGKEEFTFHAVWLVPVTFPFLLVLNILIVLLSSLAFGLLITVFPVALLAFRKPFLIKWIQKQAQKVGIFLLKINTGLLRAAGLHPPLLRTLSQIETIDSRAG